MKASRGAALALTFTGAAAALLVGCNAILGNEEGTLRAALAQEGGAGEASTTADAAGDAPIAFDGGGAFDAAVSCDQGKKLCAAFQACVSYSDPNFGCGNGDCLACKTENASAVACVGTDGGIVCSLTCKDGFKDCTNADGCETDLSKASSCGDCNTVCGQSASLCSRGDNGTFGCVSDCKPGQTKCGTQCVDDIKTNPLHCNGCDIACPVPTNGAATCVNGQCGKTCNVQFHECGGVCVPDSDFNKCGTSCTDCATRTPAHATGGSCQDGKCVWSGCMPGFDDCDGDLPKGFEGNGCETDLFFDPNCGYCGFSCGGVIVQGLHSLIPPPPPGQFCCNGACVPDGTKCDVIR